jgi:hypothetical protein
VRRFLCLLLVVPVVAGCGAVATSLPPAHAASPQRADLRWKERFGDASGGLEFGVSWFEVTRSGWRAQISLKNDTDVPFALRDPALLGPANYGVMLFSTGAHSELDQRNASQSLPVVRRADTFEPVLPSRLQAHASWTGVISARGPLAAGSWVRIVFGPLASVPTAPGKTDPALPETLRKANADKGVVWITDHAYRLRLKS